MVANHHPLLLSLVCGPIGKLPIGEIEPADVLTAIRRIEGKGKLESPYLFNITRDPKEETDVLVYNTWVLGPILKMVKAFNDSVKAHPNVSPGKED